MDITSSHDFITPVKIMKNRPDTQRAFGNVIEENNNVCVSMPEYNNGKRNNICDDIASNLKYKGNKTDLNDNKSFHSFRQNAKSKSVLKSSKMNNNSSGMKINERYNVN